MHACMHGGVVAGGCWERWIDGGGEGMGEGVEGKGWKGRGGGEVSYREEMDLLVWGRGWGG